MTGLGKNHPNSQGTVMDQHCGTLVSAYMVLDFNSLNQVLRLFVSSNETLVFL
jgi:hypothetical protein